MQETLKKLEVVQEVDLQIDGLLRKKEAFPQRLSAHQQEIATLTAKQQEKQKAADELEKSRKQQLGALELNEDRAKRSQEKLELIKTNQEYQALSKELESLKKNSAVIQENANKVGEEFERIKKELAVIETTLAEIKTKFETESSQIGQEEGVINEDLAKLREARGAAIVGIEKRYLTAYDRIRQNKAGTGVATALGGYCKGCNMRIPPQIYNEIQRGTEMHTCPSCRRILIHKDDMPVNASSAAQI